MVKGFKFSRIYMKDNQIFYSSVALDVASPLVLTYPQESSKEVSEQTNNWIKDGSGVYSGTWMMTGQQGGCP